MSENQSIAGLEAEVVARRERLGRTIDQLVETASPKNVVAREVESVRARFADTVQTPEGELRVERIAAAVAVVAVVGGLVAWRVLRR
ncbi:DUF3618 domain-containing protein [Phycicoccus sp. BSK3Z-2]|uniref:DUF3618 domain-containing protein n=1 Tax=Phycicoccus avicenniae TaxID=2828860 RepID=A0A941I089_9MICO|nr:DUF3618 domain-containing protein [Phycicoccus avicenniae]MBR7742909.1 DUF3618 domain-containing protein [Phycicoccus avicenniae]